jgi:hypothetical protein
LFVRALFFEERKAELKVHGRRSARGEASRCDNEDSAG